MVVNESLNQFLELDVFLLVCIFLKILFYFILGCVLPLQDVALHQSPLTCSVLCCSCPICSLLPLMSSLQQRVGLPIVLAPFICHSVLLIVHLLSFLWVMCPAHFHFILVTYWTASVTLVPCLMMVLWILSFGFFLFFSSLIEEEKFWGCRVFILSKQQ